MKTIIIKVMKIISHEIDWFRNVAVLSCLFIKLDITGFDTALQFPFQICNKCRSTDFVGKLKLPFNCYNKL